MGPKRYFNLKIIVIFLILLLHYYFICEDLIHRTSPLVFHASISHTKDHHHETCKKEIVTCLWSIAWSSLSAARRCRAVNRLVVPQYYRAPRLTRLPCFLLSPGVSLCIARRYTSSVKLLILDTLR